MAEAAFSSVLTEPSKQHSPPTETFSRYSRRGFWPQILAARRLYAFLDDRKFFSRDKKLMDCRTMAWFARHEVTGAVRVMSSCCHLRWCPVCQHAKKNYISQTVSSWIRTKPFPKFMTLTLRHSTSPLYFQIRELYYSFVKLRRMKFFKNAVPGGVWFFQVKKSKTDNLWHPHLHCLIYGDFIPVKHLKHLWSKATKVSHIVDIRPIRDLTGAASEVARYATSPGTLVGLPIEDAAEMATSMEGRKVCGTWGTGRSVSLRPPKEKDRKKWKNIGSFTVIANNRQFYPECEAIWSAWQKNEPLSADVTMIPANDSIMEEATNAKGRDSPWLF